MTDHPTLDATWLAQVIYDLRYDDLGREHDYYPRLVVTLGDGRTGDVGEVRYVEADNVLVLHVDEHVTEDAASPAPRGLTAAERERVAEVRDVHAWYRSTGRDDARVGDLLALVDRLTEEDQP